MKSIRALFQYRASQVLLAVFIIVSLTGVSCLKGEELPPPEPFTLTIWRTTDSENDFDPFIEKYKAAYSYVDFEVRVFRPDEYEQALFNAWAKGEGPDIFSIPNYRMGRFRDVIAQMPQEVQLLSVATEASRFGGKKIIVEQKVVPQLGASQVENLFVGPVAQDVVFEDQIYGLPLSMDTLVLYYNRDLLSRAQIAVPPTTWEEFVTAVQAENLILLDEEKQILQAATALGTAKTVPYFFDILSVLMMQNGVEMLQEGDVAFGSSDNKDSASAALSFYTSFSDPSKKTYTWNDEGLDGLESFIQGNTAFYFGYFRDKEIIEQRATGLNFSWTKLPQVDSNNPVNYATYPVEAVHIQSEHTDHAWNFVRFAATAEPELQTYAESAGHIPALRTLVGELQENPDVGIFAQQSLTARSWYHGADPDAAIAAIKAMIDTANEKTTPLEDSIAIAEKAVALTWEKEE